MILDPIDAIIRGRHNFDLLLVAAASTRGHYIKTRRGEHHAAEMRIARKLIERGEYRLAKNTIAALLDADDVFSGGTLIRRTVEHSDAQAEALRLLPDC